MQSLSIPKSPNLTPLLQASSANAKIQEPKVVTLPSTSTPSVDSTNKLEGTNQITAPTAHPKDMNVTSDIPAKKETSNVIPETAREQLISTASEAKEKAEREAKEKAEPIEPEEKQALMPENTSD